MAKAGEFQLPSGRWLYLRNLTQYLTYEGLLEGLPTAERNKEILDRLILKNTGKPYEGQPYLIQPTERFLDIGRKYPFGTPSSLPEVICIGRFDSLQPARNPTSDLSGLVVIWFQEDFAFPIDQEVLTKLLAIDWEKHAADMDY
jgi:hypothetical protein